MDWKIFLLLKSYHFQQIEELEAESQWPEFENSWSANVLFAYQIWTQQDFLKSCIQNRRNFIKNDRKMKVKPTLFCISDSIFQHWVEKKAMAFRETIFIWHRVGLKLQRTYNGLEVEIISEGAFLDLSFHLTNILYEWNI